MTAIPACPGRTAAVLVRHPGAGILLLERVRHPLGWAGPAGHVDPGEDPADAAVRETKEETGLDIIPDTLQMVETVWRDDRCRRPDSRGHHHHLFTAQADGLMTPAPAEAHRLEWVPQVRVQALAYRTVQYAAGLLTRDEFRTDPGLEPAWCWHMATFGVITLPVEVWPAIDVLARQPGDPRDLR